MVRQACRVRRGSRSSGRGTRPRPFHGAGAPSQRSKIHLRIAGCFRRSPATGICRGSSCGTSYVEDSRQLGQRLAHLQPVGEVVAHVVAAEGQHGHGVAAELADLAGGRGGGLGPMVAPRNDAVQPVEGLVDQRHDAGAAAAEDDGVDGHALGSSHSGAIDRVLRGGGGEAGVGMGRFAVSRSRGPGCRASRCSSAGFASVMPSHQMSPSGVSAHVGEDGVARRASSWRWDWSCMLVPGTTPK